MSAFKRLKRSDVITVPYIANKQWRFQDNELQQNGISIYSGSKGNGRFDLINDQSSSGEYNTLIFDSVNHLYYHQFSGSYLNPTSLGSTFLYESASIYRPSGSYYDYMQKYNFTKNFPTGSNPFIKVISVPQQIYGLGIKPGTFYLSSLKTFLKDDSEGNIVYLDDATTKVGNIFYEHGIIVLISSVITDLIFDSIVLQFQNCHVIFEKSIKCVVKDYELEYSYNKTLIVSGSSSDLKSFATASYFTPYITTVGLYNDSNDLLAVAKFSQPVPMPSKTDFTSIIKMDW